MNKKSYIIDSSAIIEDPKCIEILRNGVENDIFIPNEVIEELDKKKKSNISHIIRRVINELNTHKDFINILSTTKKSEHDNQILLEIVENLDNIPKPVIFVTNDKMLSFKAYKLGIQTEEFKSSIPYKSESEKYTGFIDIEKGENIIQNCFYWKEGKLCYNKQGTEKLINYDNNIWNVTPNTPYQNAALELILDSNIDLVSIQAPFGMGKNMITQAASLYLTFEKKLYDKIFVIRPIVESGKEIGFLPGDIEEKIDPYFKPIKDLYIKLHKKRAANKLFLSPEDPYRGFNPNKIEFLPINFLRGSTISDAFVIIDEAANFSRNEMRLILGRMGENVKCVILGDVLQIDNQFLNQENNALSWVVKLLNNSKNYGHIVLKGKTSRGPIASLILDKGL